MLKKHLEITFKNFVACRWDHIQINLKENVCFQNLVERIPQYVFDSIINYIL